MPEKRTQAINIKLKLEKYMEKYDLRFTGGFIGIMIAGSLCSAFGIDFSWHFDSREHTYANIIRVIALVSGALVGSRIQKNLE